METPIRTVQFSCKKMTKNSHGRDLFQVSVLERLSIARRCSLKRTPQYLVFESLVALFFRFFFSQLNNMADKKVTLFGLPNYEGEMKVRILNELNTMSYPRAIDSHHLFQ